MGPWYVIAHIPPSKTENAYNALECYALVEPGKIATVFTYREGSFDGERLTMKPTGHVVEGTGNAIWAMEFFWPIKLQYVITHVGRDYETAIVARSDLDYAWIMARTPKIPASIYADLVERLAALGYDMPQLREVPQQPLDQRDDGCPRARAIPR
ncbi:MAG: lipocalin family protein [Salinisphaera sp.]|nr:lipocalin family protein [Salinisphaera sp.]